MANYATLKAAIADVVKTNGSQAITGDNLQQVLLSVVNSIGSGYLFMGVATPSTDPGTPDQNVFYITGAGTFANMGSTATIPVGSIGVFKYNGSWSNEYVHIYSFNENLIEAGGVLNTDAIGIIKNNVASPYIIKGVLVDYSTVTIVPNNNNYNLVCFTIKRESDWAIVSGIGTSNTRYYMVDPTIGINPSGLLAKSASFSKYTTGAFMQNMLNIRANGYKKDILVCINVVNTNPVVLEDMHMYQGKFDSRYFCVKDTVLEGFSSSTALMRKSSGNYTTPYLKLNGKAVAAVGFISRQNVAGNPFAGIHFYDSSYVYVGTMDLSSYGTMTSQYRRTLMIETDDIPTGAAYIRLSCGSNAIAENVIALAEGVEPFETLGITDFTTEHFFDKSSIDRMIALPFVDNVNNSYITDLYELSGGQIILQNIYLNEGNANKGKYIALYSEDKEYLSTLVVNGTVLNSAQGVYTLTIPPSMIPAGAKYLTFFGYTGYLDDIHILSGIVDLNSPAYNYPKLIELENELDNQYIKEELIPFETINGFFMSVTGLKTSTNFYVRKYHVTAGESYYNSFALVSPSHSFIPVFWMNDEDDIVGHNEIAVGIIKVTEDKVTAPVGATQAWVNGYIPSSIDNSFSRLTDVLKINVIEDEVDQLQSAVEELGGTSDKLMKVVISQDFSSFYIRTKYNDEKDIILTHYINGNGLISFDSTYIGERYLSDVDLISSNYLIAAHIDSTAPIRTYTQYWHLFAQHGYPVPYFTNTVGMTASDVGATWKDQLNRLYTIGKVTDSRVWLLPVIYQDANGHYTRDWYSTHTSPDIESLVYVEGGSSGAYTTPIDVTGMGQEQLRPIMSHNGRTWIVGGKPVSEGGTYWCDDFCVSETQVGYDPATVSSWFGGTGGTPDLSGAEVMAEFTASYNYKGAQCAVNTTINLLREAKGTYSGTQQQFFFDKGDYKAMFMIPKAAPRGGVEIDKPFNSPNTESSGFTITRSAQDLKDIDDPVDRQIGFLYDENEDKYLVGLAAGLSLVSGDTVTAKRNINRPVGSSLLGFSPANTNKFYVYATDSSVFESGYFPVGYFKEINYYVSYFDPAENVGQVYWYKDGSSYVIYAHCQSEQHNLAINVPAIMEGLSLDVVEKTDDAELLTGTIQNGKFFVNYNSDDANYIVLKTK